MEALHQLAATDSRLLYLALVSLVALARLTELNLARRNHTDLLARGAVEVGRGHYPVMVTLHTAFLVACPLEVWWFDRPARGAMVLAMGAVLALAMGLRLWVISTLGRRWTTRVLHLQGEPLITTGPYRWLRHPNYLAVALEILALPLVHGAWISAAFFSLANAALLKVRISVENGLLYGRSTTSEQAHEPTPAAERP